jgi:hypothetical protein
MSNSPDTYVSSDLDSGVTRERWRSRPCAILALMRAGHPIAVAAGLVFAFSGCGSGDPRPTRPYTLAETTRAFARHGIELERAPAPFDRTRGVIHLFASLRSLDVRIFPTVQRASSIEGRTVFVLGSGKPTRRQRRNVVISWTGVEDARVAAALSELR